MDEIPLNNSELAEKVSDILINSSYPLTVRSIRMRIYGRKSINSVKKESCMIRKVLMKMYEKGEILIKKKGDSYKYERKG